ncbi:MAG: HipA domain-containing protein, partial [Verrucomicrobiota bacterium]
NEHFCLSLANEVGIKTAETSVEKFGEHTVIIVKRFDRYKSPERNTYQRIHQEDFCQALKVHPTIKYQSEGGPSPAQIIDVLRSYSSRPQVDIWRFCEALAFNWLISGTDAHAKNFSIMIAAQGQVRLAPLYDVISTLPYSTTVNQRKAKMAMKIGGKYKVEEITGHRWVDFANENRLSPDELLNRIEKMTNALTEALIRISEQMQTAGIEHDVIGRLVESIGQRVVKCQNSIHSARLR